MVYPPAEHGGEGACVGRVISISLPLRDCACNVQNSPSQTVPAKAGRIQYDMPNMTAISKGTPAKQKSGRSLPVCRVTLARKVECLVVVRVSMMEREKVTRRRGWDVRLSFTVDEHLSARSFGVWAQRRTSAVCIKRRVADPANASPVPIIRCRATTKSFVSRAMDGRNRLSKCRAPILIHTGMYL